MTEERKVDWGRPIEAVHEDGRVVALGLDRTVKQPDWQGLYTTTTGSLEPGVDNKWWKHDGRHNWIGSGWHIRNVAQPDHIRDVPKLVPTLPDDLTARMVELVKWMDEKRQKNADYYTRWGFEAWERARAIVAEMEPVDKDEREARGVLATCGWVDDDASYDAAMEVAREAIQRGRKLAIMDRTGSAKPAPLNDGGQR